MKTTIVRKIVHAANRLGACWHVGVKAARNEWRLLARLSCGHVQHAEGPYCKDPTGLCSNAAFGPRRAVPKDVAGEKPAGGEGAGANGADRKPEPAPAPDEPEGCACLTSDADGECWSCWFPWGHVEPCDHPLKGPCRQPIAKPAPGPCLAHLPSDDGWNDATAANYERTYGQPPPCTCKPAPGSVGPQEATLTDEDITIALARGANDKARSAGRALPFPDVDKPRPNPVIYCPACINDGHPEGCGRCGRVNATTQADNGPLVAAHICAPNRWDEQLKAYRCETCGKVPQDEWYASWRKANP